MATQAVRQPEGRVRQVGKVVTQVTITNHADEILAARGFLDANSIRSVTLDEVLVDTGATTLCLPADIIAALGLPRGAAIDIETATGRSQASLYDDAKVTLQGRSATFECVERPVGAPPLLGVFPLERLGVELDLQNQRLRLLPDTGPDTYFLAPSPQVIR